MLPYGMSQIDNFHNTTPPCPISLIHYSSYYETAQKNTAGSILPTVFSHETLLFYNGVVDNSHEVVDLQASAADEAAVNIGRAR